MYGTDAALNGAEACGSTDAMSFFVVNIGSFFPGEFGRG
jgi:hypothetical protein